MTSTESGMRWDGEQAGLAAGDWDRDGRLDLAVAQTGDEVVLLRNRRGAAGLRVRLEDGPGNPWGIGASVRWTDTLGMSPRHAVRVGHGSGGQDAAALILAMPADGGSMEVTWPGGERTMALIEKGTREIHLRRPPGKKESGGPK